MVAAWISADTGVGPSMASGNHACSGTWPDLPQAPSNSSRAIAVTVAGDCSATCSICANTPAKETVPSSLNIRKMARARPTSPTRFMMNAFLAAVAADGRSDQKPISRYDARPTPSHPAYRVTKELPSTNSSIAATNRFMYAKNLRRSASWAM